LPNKSVELLPAGESLLAENARQDSFHLLQFLDLFSVQDQPAA
jgi:hypothetical protein